MDGLVGADLVGRALHDHAAVVHHRHPLGDAQRHVHVVLDQDQRDRRIERQQELGELHALGAGEARGRLVEHHQLRVRRARHAHLELALLAVGELHHELVEPVARARRRRPSRGRARGTPRRARSAPAGSGPRARRARRGRGCPATERPPNRREVWNVRESPRRARLRAGSAVTSSPNSSTLPVDGGNSPEIRLNSVVLPAPFGPRMARRSPGRTSRSTSDTATTPPNRRPTPRRRRIGAAVSTDVASAAIVLPASPRS